MSAALAPAPAAECLLQAHGLRAGYGGVPAIRDVDVEVRSGEVVVLLGANGAGKTTMAMCLAGALTAMAGEIRWRGAAAHAPLHRRVRDGLALVADDRSVFMGLTVAQNLRVCGVDQERALGLFPELRDHLRRKAGMLSGGQQQMLAVGRALASEPALLIADELSLGLAPVIVERLFRTLRAAADEGVAILLVEQFPRRALAVADRAYILKHGEVVLTGVASDLLTRFDEVERAYLTEA